MVHLDVRREIAELPLPGLPHLGSGISWMHQGRRVMATPHLNEAAVSVIDMNEWRVIKRIETLGPGFFMRSHENSPYAWVDVFFGPHKDAVHVIDKETLEIVRTLRPAPGKTAAHVEFTRDGRFALLSIWEMDGAIVVYDARHARGGDPDPDGQAVRQVQCLEQDPWLRGHQPLSPPAGCRARAVCARHPRRGPGTAAEHARRLSRALGAFAEVHACALKGGPGLVDVLARVGPRGLSRRC